MARKVLSSDILLNPASLLGVLNAATESLTTDPQLANIENLRDLALSMKELRPKDITFTTMPWKQSGDGSTVVVAKKRAAPLWSAICSLVRDPTLILAVLANMLSISLGYCFQYAAAWSTEALGATRYNSTYSVAKHASIGLTRAMAVDLGRHLLLHEPPLLKSRRQLTLSQARELWRNRVKAGWQRVEPQW